MENEKNKLNEQVEQAELNENELDKVTGGGYIQYISPCEFGNFCVGSSCTEYASCTKGVKK